MSQSLRWFVVLGAAAAVTACAEPPQGAITDPATASADGLRYGTSPGPTAVECPIDVSVSASGTIGALGGEVGVNGHRASFPLGAVLAPTDFTLTVPVSNYMYIDVGPSDHGSVELHKPVTVVISYERCTRSNIDKAPLSVWHYDPATGALLENMGGVDDKVARTVTFTTDHFSGFIIAN